MHVKNNYTIVVSSGSWTQTQTQRTHRSSKNFILLEFGQPNKFRINPIRNLVVPSNYITFRFLSSCVCVRPAQPQKQPHTQTCQRTHTFTHKPHKITCELLHTPTPTHRAGQPQRTPRKRERERGKGRVECFVVLFTTFHVIFEVIFLIFFPTRASVDNRNAWQRFTTHACQTAHSIPVQILELQLGKCVGIGIY